MPVSYYGFRELLILSDWALEAYLRGLVTFDQVIAVMNQVNPQVANNNHKLGSLLSEQSLLALQENYITFDQLASLPCHLIMALTSSFGSIALKEGLITLEQAIGLSAVSAVKVALIFSENGISALQGGFSLDRICSLTDDQVRRLLGSGDTQAGSEGLMSRDAEATLQLQPYQLEFLLSPKGFGYLMSGAFTIEDIGQLHQVLLETLFQPNEKMDTQYVKDMLAGNFVLKNLLAYPIVERIGCILHDYENFLGRDAGSSTGAFRSMCPF
jgi:hypothetical protein